MSLAKDSVLFGLGSLAALLAVSFGKQSPLTGLLTDDEGAKAKTVLVS